MRTKSNSPTTYDLILTELRGIKESVGEIKGRMDKIEGRIDRLESEIRSSTRHSQILTVSVVGIALAVIYAVLKSTTPT